MYSETTSFLFIWHFFTPIFSHLSTILKISRLEPSSKIAGEKEDLFLQQQDLTEIWPPIQILSNSGPGLYGPGLGNTFFGLKV